MYIILNKTYSNCKRASFKFCFLINWKKKYAYAFNPNSIEKWKFAIFCLCWCCLEKNGNMCSYYITAYFRFSFNSRNWTSFRRQMYAKLFVYFAKCLVLLLPLQRCFADILLMCIGKTRKILFIFNELMNLL